MVVVEEALSVDSKPVMALRISDDTADIIVPDLISPQTQ